MSQHTILLWFRLCSNVAWSAALAVNAATGMWVRRGPGRNCIGKRAFCGAKLPALGPVRVEGKLMKFAAVFRCCWLLRAASPPFRRRRGR